MHIRYGYKIEIICAQPLPLVAMLDVHPTCRADITDPDEMTVLSLEDGSALPAPTRYMDQFGNICRRIVAPAGGVRVEALGVIHDSGFPDPRPMGGAVTAPEDLPDDTLVFLLGSRYCETDRLSDWAWRQFGAISDGGEKVTAICDWVHHHIRFDYRAARSTRTAHEAFEERTGVCRDYAHLAIALCRCLNIPARYCTGYLGDIGVPLDPNPGDFSAWFEVYLGGQWWVLDARHNTARIGRILIARGRDATDVPIVNSFGTHWLGRFDILTEEVSGDRFPMTSQARREHWHQHAGFEHGN